MTNTISVPTKTADAPAWNYFIQVGSLTILWAGRGVKPANGRFVKTISTFLLHLAVASAAKPARVTSAGIFTFISN